MSHNTVYKVVLPSPIGDGTYRSLLMASEGRHPAVSSDVVAYRMHQRTLSIPGTLGLYAFPWVEQAQAFMKLLRSLHFTPYEMMILGGDGSMAEYSERLSHLAAYPYHVPSFYARLAYYDGVSVVSRWTISRLVELNPMVGGGYTPLGTILLTDFTPEAIITRGEHGHDDG